MSLKKQSSTKSKKQSSKKQSSTKSKKQSSKKQSSIKSKKQLSKKQSSTKSKKPKKLLSKKSKKPKKKQPKYSLITNEANEIQLYFIAHGDGYRIQNTLNNNLNNESISDNFSNINKNNGEYPIIYNNTKPLYVWTSTLEKDKKAILFYHFKTHIPSIKLRLRNREQGAYIPMDDLPENDKICTPIELINDRQKYNKDDIIFNQVSSMQMIESHGYDTTIVDDNFSFFIVIKNNKNDNIEIKKLNITYLKPFFKNMDSKELKKNRPRIMEVVNFINEKIKSNDKITLEGYEDNKEEFVIIGDNKNLVLNTFMCSPNSENDIRKDIEKKENKETHEQEIKRVIEPEKCLKILLITVLRFIIYYESKNKFIKSYKCESSSNDLSNLKNYIEPFEGNTFNFMDEEEIDDLKEYTVIFMKNHPTFSEWEKKKEPIYLNQMEEFKKILCAIKKVNYENTVGETKTTNTSLKIVEYIKNINLDWIYEYYVFQVTHTELTTPNSESEDFKKKFKIITNNLQGGIKPKLITGNFNINDLIDDRFRGATMGGKKRKNTKKPTKYRKKTKRKLKITQRKKTKRKLRKIKS